MTNLLDFAKHALLNYAIGDVLDVALVNISENATFKVTYASGEIFALRIHREGYHSKLAIQSELAWLMALRDEGVVITARPIETRNGDIIQTVTHQNATRFVVMFEWERGDTPEIADDLIVPFKTLGETAARMHQHVQRWQKPDWFQRFTWDFETSLGEDNPHWGRWRNGIGVGKRQEKLFARTVATIEARLRAYGKAPERFGLIHGDLRLANLLIDGPQVKVIDFDDMGFGWFMYDAAATISFHEHEPQSHDLIEAWKEGYRRTKILTKEDEAEIPTFIMLRRLLLVAWIGSHHDTELAQSLGAPYTDDTMKLCENYLTCNPF